mmetsp:Transcript_7400/g.16871  ORF Transcript_7400/g.16871 Transcript_7400/m.16871 type:complete len:151 (-) Transcript_7400:861-1313(-)|eukprot:755299-Hanusia_phi.AAC.4
MWGCTSSSMNFFGLGTNRSTGSKDLKWSRRAKYDHLSESGKVMKSHNREHNFSPPAEASGTSLPLRMSPHRGSAPHGFTSLALDEDENKRPWDITPVRIHGSSGEGGSERAPLSPCRSSRVNAPRSLQSPGPIKRHAAIEDAENAFVSAS